MFNKYYPDKNALLREFSCGNYLLDEMADKLPEMLASCQEHVPKIQKFSAVKFMGECFAIFPKFILGWNDELLASCDMFENDPDARFNDTNEYFKQDFHLDKIQLFDIAKIIIILVYRMPKHLIHMDIGGIFYRFSEVMEEYGIIDDTKEIVKPHTLSFKNIVRYYLDNTQIVAHKRKFNPSFCVRNYRDAVYTKPVFYNNYKINPVSLEHIKLQQLFLPKKQIFTIPSVAATDEYTNGNSSSPDNLGDPSRYIFVEEPIKQPFIPRFRSRTLFLAVSLSLLILALFIILFLCDSRSLYYLYKG